MSLAIILDKSFLQGSKASRIHELATTHRLVVSDALFYELLTSSEPGRSRCFAKFPPVENPVDLVSHIGTLMRLEINAHAPCGRPSEHREQLVFNFNPRLVNADYLLPEKARANVEKQTAELRSEVKAFVEQVGTIRSFLPNLLTGTDAYQRAANADAERALVEPRALIPFYSQLEPPSGEKVWPTPELVSEEWAIYRWLQVKLLFALDVYVRYRGVVPQVLSRGTYEKMEHDVLDAQIFALGCLEGAIATREKKQKRWWALVCPTGSLYE